MNAEPPDNRSNRDSAPSLRVVRGGSSVQLTPEQQQLVLSVQGFVKERVTALAPHATREEWDDFAAEANLAASMAARRFRISPDVRFSTYVYPVVCGAIWDRMTRENTWRRLRRAASRAAREYLAEEPDTFDVVHEEGAEIHARLKGVADRFLAAMFAGMSAGQPDPEQELADIESYQIAITAVHEALEGLGDEERKLYRMYYIEGLSQAEIGAKLGVETRSVRRYHEKLLDRLREVLENRGIREAPKVWR
jgi:RNA polymerase sigma factor (sigma-70 family)